MKTAQKVFEIFRLTPKNTNLLCRHLTTPTMSAQTVNDVKHNKEKCEFFLHLSEGERALAKHKAYLSYAWTDQGCVDLYHTGVPPIYRGHGVAKLLAKAAFDFVVEEDLKMTLTCTYLQKYLSEHPLPDYQSRVVSCNMY